MPELALEVSSDPCTREDNYTSKRAVLEMIALVPNAKK